MKRYIDADRLKAEIESLKSLEYPCDNSEQNFGFEYALDRLSDSLDSLQQEQPSEDLEDLNAEIEMQWNSFNKHLAEYGGESEEVVWLNWNSFVDIARHFYELGKQAKKEE